MDPLFASQFKPPQGKTKVLLQFNKLSKELISILTWVDPKTLNSDYFIYHEAVFNFDTDVVIGNADKFEVVDKASQPIEVYESALNQLAAEKITDKYPITKQLNIIAKAIETIASRIIPSDENVDALVALDEMMDYVNEIKRSNEQRKRLYRESPEYKFISDEEVENVHDRQLEGGLHEAFGGRVITGGRVF